MSELDDIAVRLATEFESRRIIVWDDPDREYESGILDLAIEGVTSLSIDGNEFGLKARVLVNEPTSKFLLYRANRPADADNWLLDVELAHGVFRADRVSMLLEQLDLEAEFRLLVADHPSFFRASRRTEALRKRLEPGETPMRVLAKMCAVLAGTKVNHRLSALVRALLIEHAKGQSSFFDQLVEYNLSDYLWDGLSRIYGYRPDSPSIADFAIWVFDRALDDFASTPPGRYRELEVDFRTLQVDRTFDKAYEALAATAASALSVKERLAAVPYTDLLDNALFDDVDQRILSELVHGVETKTITQRDVDSAVRARLSLVRDSRFEPYYRAVAAASALLTAIDGFSAPLMSFDEGLTRYSSEWFVIDQHYRHFIAATKLVEKAELLATLRDQVESSYVTEYLYEQGMSWQQQVDAQSGWTSGSISRASDFYRDRVNFYLMSGKQRKVAVIISDAMRYEVADELRTRIRQEDRYEADLTPMLGALPSFTQLGMAALLPHEELELVKGGKLVRADGLATDGTANRAKLLAKQSGTAIQASEFLNLTEAETRALFVAHQVLYVYHDRIDDTGDSHTSEGRVFEAVESTLLELVSLVKKLTNANATNILITADHGFQYQDKGLEDSAYLSETPKGGDMLVTKRYVIGDDLVPADSMKKFTSSQLGLAGSLEVQIPKSTHRIRLGAGTRFVHGGASLQEIVVPVLAVNKSRKSDTRRVDVKIMPSTDKITTGQLVIRLNQVDAVDDKVQPRTLRIGLYGGGDLISNAVTRVFDQTTDDPIARIDSVTLALSSDADAFEGGSVELRLDERDGTTNYFKTLSTALFQLKRSFTADF